MSERANQKTERENIIWYGTGLYLKLAGFLWDTRYTRSTSKKLVVMEIPCFTVCLNMLAHE